VAHEGDYYRTRLTHSIEVAQVARTIAKVLKLNDELTEAIALAHDLGHTPFGHTGEEALNCSMGPYGGFDHNAQALKVVTFLEQHYASWNGLNLTWETLEGLAKHNGPVIDPIPPGLLEYSKLQDLELHTNASAEAQVAAISDDIAYNNHDLHDGLRANLFTVVDLQKIPLLKKCFKSVDDKYINIEESRRIHEVLRLLFGKMVEDVIETSMTNLSNCSFSNVDEIRTNETKVIKFSNSMWSDLTLIREFLFNNMYRAPSVMLRRKEATTIVAALFETYLNDSQKMPDEWSAEVKTAESKIELATIISDYIAGMTDRFAYQEAARLNIFVDDGHLKFV
jgi:dGTPase